MRRLYASCTALALITGLAVTVPSAVTPQRVRASTASAADMQAAPGKPSREVFGYALAGSVGDPNWGYTSWDWSLLGTVAYFGIHIADNGTIVSDSDWTTWNSSVVTSMMSTAHAAGTRVLMTIDLQDFTSGNPHMCAGLTNRATTVAQAVAAVKARGADGLSVDYEGLDGTCPNGQTSRAMMTDFLTQLRAALGASSYLSVATYASSASDSLGFFDVAGIAPYVDSFFVMAYDLEYSNYRYAPIWCTSFCLGPTAPLGGYHYNDTNTASQYIAAVPASKVILGVPYYGRKSCVASAALNPYPMGGVSADTYLDAAAEVTDPTVRPGSYVSHNDPNDPSGAELWNTWYNTSLGCERELYIDNAASLGKKYDLVNGDNLRGVGIWTLNYGGGAPELWNALRSHFQACTASTTTLSATSPQPIGVQVTVSAVATGCANPTFEFWLRAPSGAWTLAQPYSSASMFTWKTAGSISGTYRISVWARAVGSVSSYDTFSAFDYTLTPACTALSVTPSPANGAPAGSPVTLTAAASGCPNPQYELWVLPPGGGWALVRPYAPSSTFTWRSAAGAAGSYRFSVWTRDATSSNPYDAFSAFQYSLTPVCSAVTVGTVPSAATAAGNNVTLTASAAGCPNPQYEFWLLPPAGTWTLLQGYGAASTFKWSSAGAGGAYRFSVWVRDATSTNSYDAFNAFGYTVIPMCSAVTATAVPASATTPGNNVTVTASASGCPNPQYEFWVASPSGAWTLAQAYSPSPTFKWSTAGKPKGAYRFSVWVRDAASPGYSGTPPYTYDTFNAFAYSLV